MKYLTVLSFHKQLNSIICYQNMKQLLRTPDIVVDPENMLKIPIEKDKLPDDKGTITPKKVSH